jgi:sulfur carrier protein ThiS
MTDELPPRANAQDFVRPFVITGGRTRAADASLKVETMVQAVGGTRDDLNFESARIVDLCYEPISIAEIAAELGIPLGVAVVVVGDLVDADYLEASCSDPVEIELSALTRMIERVRAL